MRFIDPLGAHRYFQDLATLDSRRIPDPERVYAYAPGVIDFGDWSAHIGPDGNRILPSTSQGARCRIAAIGDSVTFGFGVNDNETWVNLVAQKHSGVRFANTAKNGYNAANFLSIARATPADGYVYLAIANDAEPPVRYEQTAQGFGPLAASEEYIWTATVKSGIVSAPGPEQEQIYREQIAGFFTTPNLLIVTVTNNLFNPALLEMRPDAVLIQPWTGTISASDPHPNAAGHREIAEQIGPAITAWLPSVCP